MDFFFRKREVTIYLEQLLDTVGREQHEILASYHTHRVRPHAILTVRAPPPTIYTNRFILSIYRVLSEKTMSRKRCRRGERETLEEQEDFQAIEDAPDERPSGSATASKHAESASERKREMERRRRDLVSTRFYELAEELKRVSQRDPWGGSTFGSGSAQSNERGTTGNGHVKRIDKEAVLKEARVTVRRQNQEMRDLNGRVQDMAAEIEILRQEKLELRKDKDYYRADIAQLREDVARLRADNFALWNFMRSHPKETSTRPDLTEIQLPKAKGQVSKNNKTGKGIKLDERTVNELKTQSQPSTYSAGKNVNEQTSGDVIPGFDTEALEGILASISSPPAADPKLVDSDVAYCV